MFPSPHPGIINFFHIVIYPIRQIKKFPSPHPGIINFFSITSSGTTVQKSFRPLIRGLSISSDLNWALTHWGKVSVPSSGDYQFLH